MRALIQKLFAAPTRNRDSSKILAKAFEESNYTSLWEDTGELIYLLDTLKLSYESERGLVTFERISLDDVLVLLDDIKAGRLAPMRQKVTAGQTAEIRISISGMSCQRMDDKVRTCAIADAAVLRSVDPDFVKSQAVFKHANMIAQHDPTVLTLPNQVNVFTYNRISPQDFLAQITSINQRFSPSLHPRIAMNRDNYQSPFTEHEQAAFKLAYNPLLEIQDKDHKP